MSLKALSLLGIRRDRMAIFLRRYHSKAPAVDHQPFGMITTPTATQCAALPLPSTPRTAPTSRLPMSAHQPSIPARPAQKHPRCADTLRDSANCGTRSVYGMACRSGGAPFRRASKGSDSVASKGAFNPRRPYYARLDIVEDMCIAVVSALQDGRADMSILIERRHPQRRAARDGHFVRRLCVAPFSRAQS